MLARPGSVFSLSHGWLVPQRVIAATLLLTVLRSVAPAQDIQMLPPEPIVVISNIEGTFYPPPAPPININIQPCDDACYYEDVAPWVIYATDGWEARVITTPKAPDAFTTFAAKAIGKYLVKQGLKPGSSANDGSDSGYKRFVISRRNEARAVVFMAVLDAIYTPALQRTAEQKAVVDYLTQRVKAKRVAAAQYALEEYDKWNRRPCEYYPPDGFTYDRPTCRDSSSGNLGDLFNFGYRPPPVADYGIALAYPELTAPQALNAVAGTAKQAEAMAAALAAGGAIGVAFPKISPSLATQVREYMLPYHEEDVVDLKSVRTSFLRFAGPIGTMLSTLVDLILVGIDVAEWEKTRGKLVDKLNQANSSTIDLSQEIRKSQGMAELLGVYTLGTLFRGPDPINSFAMPPLNALKLKVTNSTTGASQSVTSVSYYTWDNKIWSASLSGNGFFTHAAPGASFGHTDSVIHYIDWKGYQGTATYNPDLRAFYFSLNGGPKQITQELQLWGNGARIILSVPAPSDPETNVILTQRLVGSPVGTSHVTDRFPYITKWGQRWTARRIGVSQWEHIPEAGGPSHISSKIDVILLDQTPSGYKQVPALCEFRPAGSSTDLMCTPWDTTLPFRYTNNLDFWYPSGWMYSVNLRP